MYVNWSPSPVLAAVNPNLSKPNLPAGGGGLTAAQKTACAQAKKLLPNMPWVTSADCGVCPQCAAAADCPTPEAQGYILPSACPDCDIAKADVPVQTGVKWWWLLVAGATGLVVGAAGARAFAKA